MEVRHYQRFADLVKAIRRKHRLSQRAMAKALKVSPGDVGQWELRLSQPSPEVALKICRVFEIAEVEYVQRLAFAERAPDWLRDSILTPPAPGNDDARLVPVERRILGAARKLPAERLERLAEKIEGWVEAQLDSVSR